jgi:ATP synthase subunit 6
MDQFEIIILKPIILFGLFDLSLTNMSFALMIPPLFSLLLLSLQGAHMIPTKVQLIIEMVYNLVVNIVKQQAGREGLIYFPLFFSIFLIILISNLIGLYPYVFTPTSHFAFTFFLAFSCNLGILILGFYKHGPAFLKHFSPREGPLWLRGLVAVIEIFSYLLRTFSLSIRLFANMMAGHALLHIISAFGVSFLHYMPLLSIFPLIAVCAIFVLELGIAFIQAYIFVVLLSIYISESISPGH